MKSLLHILIFVILFSLEPSFAGSLNKLNNNSNIRSNCDEIIDRLGSVDIHLRPSKSDCYLSIKPYRGPGLIYRSYLFTAKGMFMVFNSFGHGGVDKTGAREFYFFPRNEFPTFLQDGENINIYLPDSSQFFTMSQSDGRFLSFSFGTISEDPVMSETNNGGIEIQSNGLMLDVGYMQGNSPASDPKRKSIFYDGQGNSCQVTNKEVFRYFGTGDVELKFDDRDLKTFLSTRCPNLIINF